MKYDDLLRVPYKAHGRDPATGLDCYGLVVECCRRAGTPLIDPYYESDKVPMTEVAEYIAQGLNVREIASGRVGSIALMEYDSQIHVGYVAERGQILHATYNKGVILSPIYLVNVLKYYEVVKNESKPI